MLIVDAAVPVRLGPSRIRYHITPKAIGQNKADNGGHRHLLATEHLRLHAFQVFEKILQAGV
jgi:hypothetical protein